MNKIEITNHFKHLLDMALADLDIDPQELSLIYQLGLEKGISESEIDELLKTPNNSFLKAPEHLKGKVSLLYDLCLVIWADGKVVKEEKELLEKVIIQCNFEKENAQEVGRYLLDKVKKGTTLKEIIEEIVANPNTQES
ncbi:MAG: TerB family tellurite resistance protein [Flavobacteriales bacterium]|nr:TerB family tellurite resistance protein [Flavobacteriales bacterium]